MNSDPDMDFNADLILVDASNVFARNMYSLSWMERSDGVKTGGLFGMIRTIEMAKRTFDASNSIICFDTKGGTEERRKLVPGYKADRCDKKPMFEHMDLNAIMRWAQASGNDVAYAEGHEADDVIAHFAKRSTGNVLIISGDHDFRALLEGERIKQMPAKPDDLWDEKRVVETHGITPREYHSFRALTGDSSDAVPGVRGIGDVKALKIMNECKERGIDILEHEMLRGKEEEYLVSLECVTFREISFDVLSRTYSFDGDSEMLDDFYREMEFDSMRSTA